MSEQDIRLGILYPGSGAEDDYSALARCVSSGVSIHTACTRFWDSHTPEAMAYTGAIAHLREGAQRLTAVGPHAVMWACTCGSFVHGLAGAVAQVQGLRDATGTPAGSTSLAFLEAVRALQVRRVAVAATYPADVAALFASFLEEGGVEVVGSTSLGVLTGSEVSTLRRQRILPFIEQADVPWAQAILVPDTAMRTYGAIASLERRLGKPVLTANQVTLWQGLRLAGYVGVELSLDPELGALFTAQAGTA